MLTTTHVAPARPDDLDAAAETLALAFESSPWTDWVIPEDRHLERLYELQRLYLAHALEHGRVWVAPATVGVIALLPHDAPEPPEDVVDQIIELHGDRVDRLGGVGMQETAGSWHVETLGVRPEERRRGVASALLVAALSEARAQGVPVTLETSDQQNLRLYERYGFVVVDHTKVPAGPDVWAMARHR